MLNCGLLNYVTGSSNFVCALVLSSSVCSLHCVWLVHLLTCCCIKGEDVRQGTEAEKLMPDGDFQPKQTRTSRWSFHVN